MSNEKSVPASTNLRFALWNGLGVGPSQKTLRKVSSNAYRKKANFLRVEELENRLAPANMNVNFSTFLGGAQVDYLRDITTDAQGNIYVAGGTESTNFPTTPGAYQRILNPGTPDGSGTSRLDVFVAKFSPAGQLIWSTLIGGPNYDYALAIELDSQGNVLVAGGAGANFPVTVGAFQTTFMGGIEAIYGNQDGFVAKLSSDGSQLLWASYFGSSESEVIRDIAVDGAGNVYLASGHTTGAYPVGVAAAFANRFQPVPQGGRDTVVAKVAANGSQVIWASYLGGSLDDSGTPSIRVDASGQAYVETFTMSSNIPTTPNAYDRTINGNWDMYLAKFNQDGTGLIFGTFFGGLNAEFTETHGLALDSQGNAYVAATTTSANLPTTSGAFQPTYGGSGGSSTGANSNYPGDGFVAKFSANGQQLLACTYVGGQFGEGIEGVGLDALGNVFVSGATFSNNFPVTSDAWQPNLAGGADTFVVKLSPSFGSIYSTYFGGSGIDYGRASFASQSGNFYMCGEVASSNWPILNAWDPSFNGGAEDSMLIELRPPPPIVVGVQVNDGSAQRSRVTDISVTFSTQVAFSTTPSAAVTLTRNSDGAAVNFSASAIVASGLTVVTLNNFTGLATQFGSLADGRYTLTVVAGQVSANGLFLDGNSDGIGGDNYQVVGSPSVTPRLFRLYGDVNGDGFVTAFDFNAFRQYFASSSISFDFDNNGSVTASDFSQFRIRFGTWI